MAEWPECGKCGKRADSHVLRGIRLYCDQAASTRSTFDRHVGESVRLAIGKPVTQAMRENFGRQQAPRRRR